MSRTETGARYDRSDKGRVRHARYNRSPKGRARSGRYNTRPAGMDRKYDYESRNWAARTIARQYGVSMEEARETWEAERQIPLPRLRPLNSQPGTLDQAA